MNSIYYVFFNLFFFSYRRKRVLKLPNPGSSLRSLVPLPNGNLVTLANNIIYILNSTSGAVVFQNTYTDGSFIGNAMVLSNGYLVDCTTTGTGENGAFYLRSIVRGSNLLYFI